MTGRQCIFAIVFWAFLEAALIALVLCTNSSGGQVDPSVVRIRWQARDGSGAFLVTGTIIDRRGQCAYVLTCWHGMRDAQNPQVLIGAQPYSAIVKDFDTLQDVMILEISDPGIPHAKLADTLPRIGEWLWVCGHGEGTYRKTPGLLTQFVSPGPPTDCRIHRQTKSAGEGPATFLECRVAARGGDSGGPILNSAGDVCGVVCGTNCGTSCGPCLPRLRGFLRRGVGRAAAPVGRPLVEVPPPIVRIPPSQAERIPPAPGPTYPTPPTSAPRIPSADPPRIPPAAAEPPPSRTSDPETLAAIAELRAEIAELRSAMKALPAGPEGPPGKDGRDGRDGIDGKSAPVSYDIVPLQKKRK